MGPRKDLARLVGAKAQAACQDDQSEQPGEFNILDGLELTFCPQGRRDLSSPTHCAGESVLGLQDGGIEGLRHVKVGRPNSLPPGGPSRDVIHLA